VSKVESFKSGKEILELLGQALLRTIVNTWNGFFTAPGISVTVALSTLVVGRQTISEMMKQTDIQNMQANSRLKERDAKEDVRNALSNLVALQALESSKIEGKAALEAQLARKLKTALTPETDLIAVKSSAAYISEKTIQDNKSRQLQQASLNENLAVLKLKRTQGIECATSASSSKAKEIVSY